MSAILYPTSFRDWELRSGGVVLKGRRGWAAGITSCLIGGVEAIIANDHGRGIQCSMSFDRITLGGSTPANPTWNGSLDDSTGSTSESVPVGLWLAPDGSKVRVRMQAAAWLGPGDVGAAPGVTTTPDQAIFDWTCTAGYLGNANLFRIQLDVILPTWAPYQSYKLMVVEALCLYFNTAAPASMSVAEDWDYATEGLSTIAAGQMLPAGPTFRSARPVISNAGGTMCGAIYGITKSSDASGLATTGNAAGLLNRAGDYRVTDHNSAGATIMNPDVQIAWNYAGTIPAGTYSYEVLMCLGTKAQVTAALTTCKAQRPSP